MTINAKKLIKKKKKNEKKKVKRRNYICNLIRRKITYTQNER